MGILRKDKICTGCSRNVRTCRCNAHVRAEQEKAARAGRPDPAPHKCPVAGCNRKVRGGVCPSPDH